PPETEIDLSKAYLDGKLKWAPRTDLKDGTALTLNEENSAFYFTRVLQADHAMPLTLSFGSDDAIKVWLNGKSLVTNKITRGVAPDQEKVTVNLRPGENRLLVKVINGGG